MADVMFGTEDPPTPGVVFELQRAEEEEANTVETLRLHRAPLGSAARPVAHRRCRPGLPVCRAATKLSPTGDA